MENGQQHSQLSAAQHSGRSQLYLRVRSAKITTPAGEPGGHPLRGIAGDGGAPPGRATAHPLRGMHPGRGLRGPPGQQLCTRYGGMHPGRGLCGPIRAIPPPQRVHTPPNRVKVGGPTVDRSAGPAALGRTLDSIDPGERAPTEQAALCQRPGQGAGGALSGAQQAVDAAAVVAPATSGPRRAGWAASWTSPSRSRSRRRGGACSGRNAPGRRPWRG